MSSPIKLKFLEKIEIFQTLRQLDRQQRESWQKTLDTNGDIYPLWFFEKKILYWLYLGHKKLGSHLTSNFFKEEKTRKLGHFNEEELSPDEQWVVFNNFCAHGFAENMEQKTGHGNEIRINETAYNFAAVVHKIYCPVSIVSNYRRYLKKYDSYRKRHVSEVLVLSWKAFFYYLIYVSGPVLLIFSALLVLFNVLEFIINFIARAKGA